jgi:hypothetical protein
LDTIWKSKWKIEKRKSYEIPATQVDTILTNWKRWIREVGMGTFVARTDRTSDPGQEESGVSGAYRY